MQHFFYVTTTIAVNELCFAMYAKPGLATAPFLQLLCSFSSSQNGICSVYIDLLYHFLRL